MLNYIFITSIGIIIGLFLGFILFKKQNNSELLSTIKEFKSSIDDYKLKAELNTKEVQNAIKDASKLAKTLTTNQNLKGQFGEDCLEAILKACYPDENINYIKQFSTLNEDNKEIRPDFLVKLPNNKSILIDCKVNIDKFIEYKENFNTTLAQDKKQEFIKDLNNTINLLSNKKYESAIINQPDFILMYIPLEPVLTLIYTDDEFISVIKNANKKNIIIVGNSSILTTIRLTKMLWAQDTQEKNIDNIIFAAEKIYNLIAQHSQALYDMKNVLEQNNERFKKEYEKITQNNSFFKNIEELRSYGIQANHKRTGKKLDEITIHDDFLN